MSIFLGKKSIVACLEISQTFQLACFRDDQHGNGKISMHKNKLWRVITVASLEVYSTTTYKQVYSYFALFWKGKKFEG